MQFERRRRPERTLSVRIEADFSQTRNLKRPVSLPAGSVFVGAGLAPARVI